MATVDWSQLTAAQERSLVLCSAPLRQYTAHLLDQNLNVLADLTDRLDDKSGSVEWNANAVIHRGCSITLALSDELSWGSQLIKLGMTITDTVTGLSGHSDLGVFSMKQPDFNAGPAIVDQRSRIANMTAYALSGVDVTADLDRQAGSTQLAPAQVDGSGNPVASGGTPVMVLANAATLLANAGFPSGTVQIDGDKATVAMQQPMQWPLFPTAAGDTGDAQAAPQQPVDADARASGPTTWREIVNDLIGQLTYGAVWAASNGKIRLSPYLDPATRVPSFLFSADTLIGSDGKPMVAALAIPRTRSLDISGFNSWVFRWVNMADVNGLTVPATDAGNTGVNGIITATNDTTGPGSIAARGGAPRGVSPALVDITAASVADFQSQCAAIVAAAKKIVTTYKVTTVPLPRASHYDVLSYIDSIVTGGQTVTVQASQWSIPLDGGDMTWTWQRVA